MEKSIEKYDQIQNKKINQFSSFFNSDWSKKGVCCCSLVLESGMKWKETIAKNIFLQ